MSETKTPDVAAETAAEHLHGVIALQDRIRELEQENARLQTETEKLNNAARRLAEHIEKVEEFSAKCESALAAERDRVAKAVEACVEDLRESGYSCPEIEEVIRREFDNSSGPG